MIPLLVLFIGIILPIKTHAMELKDTDESVTKTSSSHIKKKKKMKGEFLWKILYLYWTRRPSRSYAKAGMNRPAGVKTAHSCGHTSS